jgi:hypothetical protein
MNLHDAWRSEAAPATGEQLQMDELTASQLADELTTLASSLFGLLQLPPGADPAQAESEAAFESALAQAIPVADPASVVSVAIPAAPVVEVAVDAVAVPEDWETPEPEPEAQETHDVPALAVPALALPEVPALALPDEPEEPESAPRHRSLAALNEIAFLDD